MGDLQNTSAEGTQTGTEGKTFTQDDVNRIVQERLAKERGKGNEELEKRVAELDLRERKLNAVEALRKNGLPDYLVEALNISTDEAFKASMDAIVKLKEETKVGLSDLVVLRGKAIAQRIKATLGITGLSLPRVHIDGVVWHLDVGSSHPGAEVGPKGWAVRPLKRYASWVQNVVRQFGPYPAWA